MEEKTLTEKMQNLKAKGWSRLLPVAVITVIGFLYINIYGAGAIIQAPVIWYWFLIILAFGWWFKFAWTYAKEKSPKIIADPIWSTTLNDPIKASHWTIDILEEIKFGNIIWRNIFKRGAVISLWKNRNSFGDNVSIYSSHTAVPLTQLPPQVVEKVTSYGIKPPYFFGICDENKLEEKVILENEQGGNPKEMTVSSMIELYKYLCQDYQEMDKAYKGDYSDMIKYMVQIDKVQQKAQGKKVSALRNWFNKKEQGDDELD